MFSSLAHFHFIRPEFLIALPVATLFWWVAQRFSRSSEWQAHIPEAMLAALRVEGSTQSAWRRWTWLLIWLIVGLAAAGPTWTKQAVPTLQNQNATVILLDLSPSMLAQDLKPDRLTRAKFKLIDILRRQGDGQTALIAYAGDAHTVSPLTDDPKTIEALLPALHPNIMPSRGSNTEDAVRLAQQLLKDAGLVSGRLLLITDGVSDTAQTVISKELARNNQLSILAVGSSEAAPIPAPEGGFVRSSAGEIVLSKVERNVLRTFANQLGGRFATLASDESDIDRLLSSDFERGNQDQGVFAESYDAWADTGHWLVLLMLPLFALFFRKGLVYCLPLAFLLPMDSQAQSTWSDLWKTPDQKAAKLLEQKEYDKAATKFERQDWSAIANYKNGDYQSAAEDLANMEDPTSLYNRANALALSGELEQAVEAYDAVLAKQADHTDAKHNKALIEKLIEQQKQQQGQEGQEGENGDSDSESSDSDSSKSQNSESQDEQQGQSEPQQPDQQGADDQASADKQGQASGDKQGDAAEKEPVEKNLAQTDKEPEELEQEDLAQKGKQATDEELDGEAVQAQLNASPEPLRDSSEQWLRSIQEDPSGLLRRKFEYQNQLRQQLGQERSKTGDQERY